MSPSPATARTTSDRVRAVRKRKGYYHVDAGIFGPEACQFAAVTTILDIVAKNLTYWAAFTAASLVLEDPERYSDARKAASGIYGVRDSAADRGTTVHSIAESIQQGGLIDVSSLPESVAGYAQAWLSFYEFSKPQIVHTEVNAYHLDLGYSGTADCIAEMQDGCTWLLDWKTRKDGGAVYETEQLQLCAYRNAQKILPKLPNADCEPCEGTGQVEGKRCLRCRGGGMVPQPVDMPTINKTGVVLLHPSGKWSLHEVDAPFSAFRAAFHLWKWREGQL